MASITEKINQLEAPDGEIGQHRKKLIEMETAIEEIIRPMKTYLLLMYAWRQRIHAKKRNRRLLRDIATKSNL